MSFLDAMDEPGHRGPRHRHREQSGGGASAWSSSGRPDPGARDAVTSQRLWTWARPLGGAAILAVLLWRLGTGPVLVAARMINGWSLAAAAAIGVLTTLCCAWRWSLVARGLGVGVPLRAAVAAYYRSQFLNLALPGGVLGDLHRAVHHGRDVGDVSRGLRAVFWERSAGQAVQLVLALTVLLVAPSPVRVFMPVVMTVVVAGVLAAVLLNRMLPHDGPSLWSRAVRTATNDLREGVLARRAWPRIMLASTVVVAGHTVTFVIAARTTGSAASPIRMLPLAVLVLLAMGVPASVAGWGPREAMAAWTFSVAGLSAAQGVATAVVYGVMVFVASLPGAGLLIAARLRHARGAGRASRRRPLSPATTRLEDAAHG